MSYSLIRCLLAVLALSDAYDTVRSKNVAYVLGIKRPTVHHALEALQEKGLICKALYGDVRLTEEGRALAEELERERDEIAMLFGQSYDLPPEESVKAALLLISELSNESIDRLRRARRHLRDINASCPAPEETQGI